MRERYGHDVETLGGLNPDEICAFVVARDDTGVLLGCGVLRSLGEPVAEVQRMYVRPAARGRGVGADLLEALEREARALGFKVVRLEAGPLQPEAIGLYARAGYREIPCFGAYAGAVTSRCFERRL
jgi:GNAT superfamily N-acetyltransferase